MVPPSPVPPPSSDVTRGWNWGAFWLNWVWGLAHNTWIALLMFVPGVNLVMPFVLGWKGNAWAWQNNTWRDEAHFRSQQRLWARVGWGMALALPALFAVLYWGIVSSLNASDAYVMALERLQTSPRVERALGRPIVAVGWSTGGSISMRNDTGQATLTFTIEGPKGRADAFVYAERARGAWTLQSLGATTERGEVLILIDAAKGLGNAAGQGI